MRETESRRLSPTDTVEWEKVRGQQEEEDKAECTGSVKDTKSDGLQGGKMCKEAL